MNIVKENAPHLRRKATVTRMMVDVLIALAPTLIFSFIVYPINTLVTYAISVFIMLASEFVFIGLTHMFPNDGVKRTFKEKFSHAYKGTFTQNNFLSAAISAVIFTLIMPVAMKLPDGSIIPPIYPAIVGSLVGIVLGKLVFGGLGQNIFNPAVLGMIVAKICFGSSYVYYIDNWFFKLPDTIADATPLGLINDGALSNINQFQPFDMFFGRIPGTLGEVYKITILIGLIYLLVRRSADFRIVVSYLGTFFVLSLVAGLSLLGLGTGVNPFSFVLYSLLSGGVLFGATFMLTDPVTSPINSPSRVIYGMVAAVMTVFIRLFAALPEGVGFSILIANMVAVVLDHYEWSNPRFSWKNILIMVSIGVLSALIVFIVLMFGGVYNG